MKGQLKSSFSIASILGSNSPDDTVSNSAAVITSHTDRDSSQQQGSPYLNPTSTVPDTPPSTPPTSHHVLPPGDLRVIGNSPKTSVPLSANRSPNEPETQSSPTYRKNVRMNYTSRQIARLEAVYQATPYPDGDVYDILSDELNLPAKKLKVWFQNKRARNKRRVSDVSPTNFPSVPMYLPVTPGLQVSPGLPMPQGLPAMSSFPYLMSGLMSQPSIMMTPPTSPVDAHTMLHPYMAYAPGANRMSYAQATSTSGSP